MSSCSPILQKSRKAIKPNEVCSRFQTRMSPHCSTSGRGGQARGERQLPRLFAFEREDLHLCILHLLLQQRAHAVPAHSCAQIRCLHKADAEIAIKRLTVTRQLQRSRICSPVSNGRAFCWSRENEERFIMQTKSCMQ